MAPLAAIPLVVIGYYGNLLFASAVASVLTAIFGYMDFGPPAGARLMPLHAFFDAAMLGIGFLALAVTANLLRRESARRIEVERRLAEAGRREREQHRLARLDPLCPIANRIAFDEFLDDALAQRRGGVAVVFVDLDGFKAVNDTFGHRVGDRVLAVAAERLASAVRSSSDLAARLGGDEFGLVLTGANEASVRAVLAKVSRLLSEPIVVDGRALLLGVSCGYALLGRDGIDADALLRAADDRMYRAKGRDRRAGDVVSLAQRPA